jgi:taurine dioxygenase
MPFKVEPLPGSCHFGAVIRDLTDAAIEDPPVREALYDLWIDKGLLVFRGMVGGRATQVKLSLVFGELELHPIPSARLPEFPHLTQLHYDPEDGYIVDLGGDVRGAYLAWHSDLIYVDRINRGGLLRAVKMPAKGGDTGFIDQIDIYSRLPDDLKARIDRLSVIYHADLNMELKKFGKKVRVQRHLKGAEGRYAATAKYPYVVHPAVFVQAETGRKVLNVSPWFAQAILGMEDEEGDQLLARIVEYCEDEAHAYYHRWQPDDMVLWDNWRMLHCCNGVSLNECRTVERTTIKGDYQLGRVLTDGAFVERHPISV